MNEAEIAHLRRYLRSQSIRRTPAQLVEAFQQVYQEFIQSLFSIPDGVFHTPPHVTEWSAAEIAEHVQAFLAVYEKAICTAIEDGKPPEDVQGAIDPPLRGASKDELLAALDASCQRLITVVLEAEPTLHLDITWGHFELGHMHWREWLLFARVHLNEHLRQIQQLVEMRG